MNRQKRQFFLVIFFSLIVGLFFIFLNQSGFFSSGKLFWEDKLYLDQQIDSRIVLVAIDDESIKTVGQWPWPRSIYSKILSQVSQAKVVGLDVNFPEKQNGVEDRILAEYLASQDNVVLPVEAIDLSFVDGNFSAVNFLKPISDFAEKATLGFSNTPLDFDGVFRRLPIKIFGGGQNFQAFFLKILERYFNREVSDEIKQDESGRMWVNFVGPPSTFPIYSVKQILAGEIGPENFKGKIVLIGATASDLHDEQIVPTSVGRPMAGIEIHANAINTVLTHNYLLPLDKFFQQIIILFLSLLGGLLFYRFKPWRVLLGFLILFFAYIILVFISFDAGVIFDLLYPILTLVTVFAILVLFQYIFTEREKRQIKSAFKYYLSPAILAEVLKSPAELKLGGTKREITVLFSDIRGFTALAERMPPAELSEFLNAYLSLMSQVIFDYQGAVDKYIGDAIMAFWNAPLEQLNHAQSACSAAVKMLGKLSDFNSLGREKNWPEINIGIGIATGEAVVGNLGSRERFDYTAVGDTVNLASRLESLNKEFKSNIIISEATYKLVQNDFECEFLGEVKIRGKSNLVRIYKIEVPRC